MKTLKKLFHALLTFAVTCALAPLIAVALPFYATYCTIKEDNL